MKKNDEIVDLAVVGRGPAGITAGEPVKMNNR